ncbi:LysR substrate-binding domain-containing protein [Noviherbaspirillum saxi]|uniref:LysR family transcriptional regulator n=1 Tax=Noviherbaspirillum saxi TaxID=2320863 RepID=A0A3A3FN54_9BURK|nr:LysR substrate-binding domain-containing protein [Noviherbaspirillum saxi]RJF92775.1 LysR family transcriptional regulator [Noviherbaspirillum saxi]
MKPAKKRLWQVDFITLRLFVAVCEEASIAHAAEREAIVASAVSKRITDIEDVIGTPLLLRHRSGVTPTPAGEALLQHARLLLRGAEKMQAELSEYASGVRGHIHIYASVSAVVEFLPDDISAFLAQHDNIKVDMEERVSNQVIRAVEENSAAIGVCWDFADTRGLQVIPYKTDHLTAVVHPDHPLAKRESVSFEETLQYDHVGQQPESLMNLFLRRVAADTGKTVFNRIHVATFEAACRIVRANLAMSIIPAEAIAPYQTALDLRVIPLTDPWAHRRFVICMRDYEALPMPTRLFVDFIGKVAQ